MDDALTLGIVLLCGRLPLISFTLSEAWTGLDRVEGLGGCQAHRH